LGFDFSISDCTFEWPGPEEPEAEAEAEA